MERKDKLVQKLAAKTQGMAENNAVSTSKLFCRLWWGVEKVPSKLLEPGVR